MSDACRVFDLDGQKPGATVRSWFAVPVHSDDVQAKCTAHIFFSFYSYFINSAF